VAFNNTTAEISSSVGSLTVSLASINATVTSIQGTNATISTSLGNLTGVIVSTNNGTANITTPLGPVKLDVPVTPSGPASNDQTWIIALVAIVGLVLVAAAAIVLNNRKGKKS
jgi:hypothetical protein